MKNNLFTSVVLFGIVVLVFNGCRTETPPSKQPKKVNEKDVFTRINDSTWSEKLVDERDIQIECIQRSFQHMLVIDRHGDKDTIDLPKEGINDKEPSLAWKSSSFICLTTWTSADFFSSLIIPVKRKQNPYFYFEHGVHSYNPKTQHIVYTADFVTEKKSNVQKFAIQDLRTHKEQFIDWVIPSHQPFHPYCDSLTLKNDCLLIWDKGKAISIPIELRK